MKVLVLGSGGREHALAWKCKNSPLCEKVFLHPGNAGTQLAGFPHLGSDLESREEVAEAAKAEGISLVVIGPETLLAKGYADHFREKGFLVVGPGAIGAQLESSKLFAKKFMKKGGIPTAEYRVANTETDLRSWNKFPIVLKLDGLAAGKGVVVAEKRQDLEAFADRIWKKKEFGPGPHCIVMEDCLRGREISYIGMCDGTTFVPLASATDYKRVGEGDQGANTGGMGCISPSPFLTSELETKIQKQVVGPVLTELAAQKIPFRGALFIGLMVSEEGMPYVLEFNTRFGDPETQAILLRLNSDFLQLLIATAKGELSLLPSPQWKKEASVYVVGCAKDYPATPQLGDAIQGLEGLPKEIQVFYSGISKKGNQLVTAGGRVLGLGAEGASLADAKKTVYSAWTKVRWPGLHYRKDIGL